MFKISKLADYAVVIMHFLSEQHGQLLSAKAIAQAIDLSLPTTSKVLKLLNDQKLLLSSRGIQGGYQLVKSAELTSLADIVAAIDGPIALTECADKHGQCNRIEQCKLPRNWQLINQIIHDALSEVSLADMSKPMLGRASTTEGVAWKESRVKNHE